MRCLTIHRAAAIYSLLLLRIVGQRIEACQHAIPVELARACAKVSGWKFLTRLLSVIWCCISEYAGQICGLPYRQSLNAHMLSSVADYSSHIFHSFDAAFQSCWAVLQPSILQLDCVLSPQLEHTTHSHSSTAWYFDVSTHSANWQAAFDWVPEMNSTTIRK